MLKRIIAGMLTEKDEGSYFFFPGNEFLFLYFREYFFFCKICRIVVLFWLSVAQVGSGC